MDYADFIYIAMFLAPQGLRCPRGGKVTEMYHVN